MGWTFTALITPGILLITSIGFFSVLYGGTLFSAGIFSQAFSSPLTLIVFFGSAQNCLSRASKYSVFDSTKEMSFIPLDHQSRVNGKAAIDGVGSRLGKSGGSLIIQSLLILFGSLTACTPFISIILFALIFVWIGAVRSLGKKFYALENQPLSQPPPETLIPSSLVSSENQSQNQAG